jgi:hypothetical protein
VRKTGQDTLIIEGHCQCKASIKILQLLNSCNS